MGHVTKFVPDNKKVECKIVYGAAVVNVDGAETCIIRPRFKVCTKSGVTKTYEWYQVACTSFGISDYATEIRFLFEKPDIVCLTNWTKAAINIFLDLLKAGLGSEEAKKVARTLVGMSVNSRNKPTEELIAQQFAQSESFSLLTRKNENKFEKLNEEEKIESPKE